MGRTEVITQSTGTATLEEWAKLDLELPNSCVLGLTRVRRDTNDHPIALEEVALALERFPGLTANDDGDVPDITELAQRHGLSLSRISERVGIVPVTREVGMHLAIAAGTNVLKQNRIVETRDGHPIEWRVAYRRI